MSTARPLQMLVVDRDPGVRTIAAAVASSLGFQTSEAASGRAALARFAEARPDLILLDPQLPDMFGYALLAQWSTLDAGIEVAILATDGSLDSAVQAMRLGACDYLPKPFEAAHLRILLQRIQQRLLPASSSPPQMVIASSIIGDDLTCLSEIERATIERVFHQVNGDKVMARKLLGISRATLYRKLKRYQIGADSNASARGEAQL